MAKKKETQMLVTQASITDVVNRLNKKAGNDFRQLQEFTIKTPEQYEEAGKRVSRLKELRKEADVQEKSITDPANLILKNTRAIFKPFKDRVDEIEVFIKGQMVAYLSGREKKAEALLEQANGKNFKKVVSKVSELQDNKSEFSNVRKIPTLEITNPKLIPHQYMVPDETKIKAALLAGKKVKGCKIVMKTSISI